MASARLTASVVWALPLAAALVLFVWAFEDLLRVPAGSVGTGLLLVLLLSFAGTVLGLRLEFPPLRRLSLALLVLVYFGAHLIALRLDAIQAVGFLTLALLTVELRLLSDRFVPLYAARLEGADRERVGSALQRSLVRIVAVTGVSFLASILAADLALAGTVPATTIPTALLLAAAFIGVILVLALWPLFERREA